MAEEKTGYSANPDYESVTTDDVFSDDSPVAAKVYDDGGTYRAIGRNGEIDSGADVGGVVQSAIDSLNKGKIKIAEGDYQQASDIVGAQDVQLIGAGKENTRVFATGAVSTMYSVPDGTKDPKIEGINFDSRGNANVGIDLPNVNYASLRDIKIIDIPTGIRLRGTSNDGCFFNFFNDIEVRRADTPLLLDGTTREVQAVTVRDVDLRTRADNGDALRCQGTAKGVRVLSGNLANAGTGTDQAAIHLETTQSSDVIEKIQVYGTWIEVTDDGNGTTGSIAVRVTKASSSNILKVFYNPGQETTDKGLDPQGKLNRYLDFTDSELKHPQDILVDKFKGKGIVVSDANGSGDRYRIRVNNGSVDAEGPL
jgi:hypothetical protein